ncbi:MAG TPA: aminodeoxychorismate/anthranilate synthase component II [Bacteroidota bacterium]|nr:aminodeoxychorismate/anthranilate synthase component II [Bacteroidota bacterium]
MILVLDNYDSFTFNLVQYLGELGMNLEVLRNDSRSVDQIREMRPGAVVISPGPCTPREAGISVPLVRALHREVPILGVCLGHQAVGEAFGGNIVRADAIFHGKTSLVHHDGAGLFAKLPSPLVGTRYHSLIVERQSLPADLVVTAWTADGVIMGLRHRRYPTYGVQFHPESIATPQGKTILSNFLSLALQGTAGPNQEKGIYEQR